MTTIAIVSVLVWVALAIVFAVTSGRGNGTEEVSPRWADALGVLGGPMVLPLVVVAIAGALLLVGRRRAAAFLLLASLGAGVLTYLAKGALQVLGADHDGGRLSDFPSGHEAVTVAFMLALLAIAWPLVASRTGRVILIALTAVVAVAMGWARVATGAHSIVDILGGAVLGIGWVAICLLAWPPEEETSAVTGTIAR